MDERRPDVGLPVRRRAIFSGTVQGVGFRYTACRVAGDFEVTGYVRNLGTGQVEVIVEGTAAELDRFIARLNERMDGYIRRVEVEESPAVGEFDAFEIRF